MKIEENVVLISGNICHKFCKYIWPYEMGVTTNHVFIWKVSAFLYLKGRYFFFQKYYPTKNTQQSRNVQYVYFWSLLPIPPPEQNRGLNNFFYIFHSTCFKYILVPSSVRYSSKLSDVCNLSKLLYFKNYRSASSKPISIMENKLRSLFDERLWLILSVRMLVIHISYISSNSISINFYAIYKKLSVHC